MMAHFAIRHILDNFCKLIFCYQYILLFFLYINCKSKDCHNFLFCYVVVINESVVYLMYAVIISGIFSSCYLFYKKKELMFFDVLKEYVMVHHHYFGKQYCFPQKTMKLTVKYGLLTQKIVKLQTLGTKDVYST